ncbi:MAG: metallophosphoesterase [Lachnospiraceae bacterium]|nr:metallophosphoesterase [Lachnospiraceae bacterium]
MNMLTVTILFGSGILLTGYKHLWYAENTETVICVNGLFKNEADKVVNRRGAMIYVISDLHGCLREFKQLLKSIHFSEKDELYILGDMMDRGSEPIKLIQLLMMYGNIYPIMGNHDYMALKVLSKLNFEISEESLAALSSDDLMDYLYWTQDGGEITARQFTALDMESREDILEYLGECSFYEEIMLNGRRYVLVHAGLDHFEENRELDSYGLAELIFVRADYTRRYFTDENTYLITGHTPTRTIREDRKDLVYQENGHIALDCGCVYGGKLAAFCLDNRQIYYVDSCEGRE